MTHLNGNVKRQETNLHGRRNFLIGLTVSGIYFATADSVWRLVPAPTR